jgi:beta-phosphoglucomutase-like phosphatase (HAD superfamily)
VADDDVAEGKPDPESYLRVLSLFPSGLDAAEVLVLEDTEAGVASALGAGMRCVAVAGTQARERLVAAERIVERIDVALVRGLLE